MGSTLAVRVAGNSYDREGYYSPDGGAIRNQEGRVKLLWEPTDSLSVLLGFAADNNIANTGGIAGQILLTSPYNTYQDVNGQLGPGSNNFRQYWANVTWDFGPATLSYLPSVRTWDSSLIGYDRYVGFPPFNSFLNTPEDNYITHELRVTSKPGSTLTWQAGALYYDNNLENSAAYIAYPSNLENTDTAVSRITRDLGVFAEATYPLASDWRITGGLRYDRTQVDTNQLYTTGPGFLGGDNYLTLALAGDTGDRTFSDWTYKARVEHDLAPDNMLYAMISTGFAPGDVTVANNAVGQPVAENIKEETLTAYEFGSKNRFLDDKLQINGDVYYEKYGGWQSAADAVVNGAILSFPVLAAGVESYGAEFEALYQLTAHDRAGFTFTWTHATYIDTNTPVAGTSNTFYTYQAQGQVVSAASAGAGATANTPASAPIPELVNVTFDHVQPLTSNSKLTLHADARWLSPHYEGPVSAEQLATNPGYFNAYMRAQGEYLGDVSATWAYRKFSLTGYVRNVGDNRYKTNVTTLLDGAFAAIPYNPRTVGIILNVGW
jgi:iron complex outermembrane receptor protein